VLVALNLRVALVCIGPVLPAIAGDLDLGSAAAGFLSGLPLLIFALASPFAPRLAREIGLDRCIAVALVTLGCGTIIRSLPIPHAIWVGTILLGAAIAVLNVLLPSLVSRDLRAENSRVTAFYTAAQGVATAVGVAVVLPLSLVLPGGWRAATAVWAVLTVIAVVVWWVTGASRQRAQSTSDPSPLTQASAPPNIPETRPIWRHPLAWVVSAFMGLQSLAFFVYMGWMPSYQAELGLSATVIGWFTATFYVLSISSSLLTGRLLERARSQRGPAIFSGVMIFGTYLGIALAPQWFLLWSITGGAACGSLMVIALSLITYRTRDFATAARLSAMSQGIGYGIAAAGPVIFGAILDGGNGWLPPVILTATLMVVMAAAGWWAGANRSIR